MAPSLPLLASEHLVVPAEVEELLATKHEPGGGQLARVVVLLEDCLDLPSRHVEILRLRPQVPIVTTDSGIFQILADQLSVHVVLPAHDCKVEISCRSESSNY